MTLAECDRHNVHSKLPAYQIDMSQTANLLGNVKIAIEINDTVP